jgi:hypothetical protein
LFTLRCSSALEPQHPSKPLIEKFQKVQALPLAATRSAQFTQKLV